MEKVTLLKVIIEKVVLREVFYVILMLNNPRNVFAEFGYMVIFSINLHKIHELPETLIFSFFFKVICLGFTMQRKIRNDRI